MEDEQKNTDLETARADRSVWLMKCPVVVAKSWQSVPADSQQNLSKVVVSLDPLHPEDPSSLQFSMEMAGSEIANMPKSYSLNMFKDFVPMCIFSEANQGKVAMEGKVEHKFDMTPQNKNMEEYRKMCRERTNKSMVKNRQIQEKKKAAPVKAPEQFLKEILNDLCVYNKRGTNQGTYELKPEYKKSMEDTTAEE
ncbi:Transcription Factor IIF, Rap30/Rap74, interaction [Cynara cardunculus var. scolymus]|uniref:Transcription Factor IIF, Rap30/Rap74, interaction n=1 Tax=Cynara cardunculus var. scolymus TaxID=59895 RepID=A0A118JYD3_CYNCS|nr:Transcription Factor IIF, Rap30/Rap74, interaction [Cynara cardunculus var. scolymus]